MGVQGIIAKPLTEYRTAKKRNQTRLHDGIERIHYDGIRGDKAECNNCEKGSEHQGPARCSTEAFARQKKLPSFSKILKDVRKKPKKTNSAGVAVLKAMAAEQGVIIR